MNERLARELVKSRQAVKQKFQSLKSAIKAQSKLQETYKPLTQPLQQLISTFGKSEPFYLKEENPSHFTNLYDTPRKKTFYDTSTPEKNKKSGKTPILPTELPSFWDTSIASTSQLPSVQETNIIAQTSSPESSDTTVGNLSDILEQTRQTLPTFIGTLAYQT